MEKMFFSKFYVFPNFFFNQILYHLGPRWKQEANGCHVASGMSF